MRSGGRTCQSASRPMPTVVLKPPDMGLWTTPPPAVRVPSGDHAGIVKLAIDALPEPSGFIELGDPSKTILEPSGDQSGSPPPFARSEVRFASPEPSGWIVYTSSPPATIESKAIREPSGDHAGLSSEKREFVRFVRPDPSMLRT